MEKSENANNVICYCFGYTEEDIIRDFIENHGYSSILEKIMVEKKAGNCRCAEKNPKKR